MRCQDCRGNEANIHIIKIVDGKKTELYLCEKCARAKEDLEFSFEPQFSPHELFAGMLGQGLLESREKVNASKIQCKSCGLTFAQFSQVGRFGCSDCFFAFKDRLKPLMGRIHTGAGHTGKVPARSQNRVKIIREMDQLKNELQSRVENEEFEEAARLRDLIRQKEKEMQEKVEGE